MQNLPTARIPAAPTSAALLLFRMKGDYAAPRSFERRKLSLGTCGRSYATPCIQERACLTEMILSWDASPPGSLA